MPTDTEQPQPVRGPRIEPGHWYPYCDSLRCRQAWVIDLREDGAGNPLVDYVTTPLRASIGQLTCGLDAFRERVIDSVTPAIDRLQKLLNVGVLRPDDYDYFRAEQQRMARLMNGALPEESRFDEHLPLGVIVSLPAALRAELRRLCPRIEWDCATEGGVTIIGDTRFEEVTAYGLRGLETLTGDARFTVEAASIRAPASLLHLVPADLRETLESLPDTDEFRVHLAQEHEAPLARTAP